jgi:hypothetical protein
MLKKQAILLEFWSKKGSNWVSVKLGQVRVKKIGINAFRFRSIVRGNRNTNCTMIGVTIGPFEGIPSIKKQKSGDIM